jgi:N-methyl-L-proline demethylase
LLEAQAQAGGQIRLLTRTPRRRELIGIIDWRLAELDRLGVTIQYNMIAAADAVMALTPAVVIVATGGMPQSPPLLAGSELTVSSWDILSGDATPGRDVLVYDDNGAHPGMQAAEMIASIGATVEVVSPERFFAPEIGGMNLVPYAKVFNEKAVRVTINTRLISVARDGNRLVATLGSPYGTRTETRTVDQVVVEHGTLPLADVYFELKPHSINRGAVDYPALKVGPVPSGQQGFRLFRIGDAVASRNIHAAIYDALRLASSL